MALQEDQGGETSEEEERNEASQAFDYPENMSKDEVGRVENCKIQVLLPWKPALNAFWRSEVIERSPLGRFVRFNRKLGSGSYKVVFLGFDNDTGPEAKIQIEVPKSLEDKENARLCRQHWDMLFPGMEVAWNIISFQNLDKLHTEFTRCQYVWVWRIQLGSLEPLFCTFLFEGLVAGTLRLLQLFFAKKIYHDADVQRCNRCI